MADLRFNHMELTLPMGQLSAWRDRIAAFYGRIFGFHAKNIQIFEQDALVLQTDADGSQFILITETEPALATTPSYDHLGFLLNSREAVEQKLEQCKAWQENDPAVEILEYDDLELPETVTRAFYVRYGLPIWFDVQHIAYRAGCEPEMIWEFRRNAP